MAFIGHTLVVGITGTGKTSLVKQLAQRIAGHDRPVMVLTPCPDDGWDFASYKTDDPVEFTRVVMANRNCVVIVDEGAEMAGRYDKETKPLATRSRHNKHTCFFIAQLPKDVNKTIRGNCRNVIAFKLSDEDAKILAKLFVADFSKCPELPEGSYIAVLDREIQEGKVF